MDGKLGIGILGYGPWGQNLARLALNTTRAWVPMIWTRGAETAAKIRANGFEATNDVDALINNPKVQAVAVLSPNALHKEQCLKVCAAGKPLFATKPLVLTLEDYDVIVAALKQSGIRNHMDFTMRFQGPTRKLLELADAGAFGEPMHLVSRSSRATGLFCLGAPHKAVMNPEISGGWTIHHMCHQVDFCIRLCRQRVVKVYAQTVKSAPECPSEESIAAILTTEKGAILEISDGLSQQSDHHLSVMGTKALAFVDEAGHVNFRGADAETIKTHGFGGYSNLYTPEGWADDSLMAFISMVTGQPHGRHYPLSAVPIAEGRHVLEVLLAIRKSAATGMPVDLK